MDVRVYMWCVSGGAVKVLMSAPFASQHSRLLFLRPLAHRVPGESFHCIPFPFFQECLRGDRPPGVATAFS